MTTGGAMRAGAATSTAVETLTGVATLTGFAIATPVGGVTTGGATSVLSEDATTTGRVMQTVVVDETKCRVCLVCSALKLRPVDAQYSNSLVHLFKFS
jgi:hypothetical protein